MKNVKVKDQDSYHHGDLAAALISASLMLIARHGVEGFSIRQAAALVGVAPSAAYRHFDDKADLIAAVASQGFAGLAVEMETAMSAARKRHRGDVRKAVAAFEAQGLAYVRFAVNNPEQFQTMFGRHGAGSQRPARGVGATGQDPYELLKGGLDELLRVKALTPAGRKNAELLAWATVHGLASLLISHALMGPGSANSDYVERVTLEIVRRLLHGLRTE